MLLPTSAAMTKGASELPPPTYSRDELVQELRETRSDNKRSPLPGMLGGAVGWYGGQEVAGNLARKLKLKGVGKHALTVGGILAGLAGGTAIGSTAGKALGKKEAQAKHPNRKLESKYRFQGFPISIETAKGSERSGIDQDGHEWSMKMTTDYGYIRGTESGDGEHLDCFIGDHPDATHVYVVRQIHPKSGKFDEDKVLLGYKSMKSAWKAYKSNYDRLDHVKGIRELPLDAFKSMLRVHKGGRLTIDNRYLSKMAKKEDAQVSGKFQDFLAGMDPLGVYSYGFGERAERAGLSEKEHAGKQALNVAGGLVGGGIGIPSAISAIVGAVKGRGSGGMLRGAAKGAVAPWKNLLNARRVSKALSRGATKGKLDLDPKELSAVQHMLAETPLSSVSAKARDRLSRDLGLEVGQAVDLSPEHVRGLVGALPAPLIEPMRKSIGQQVRSGLTGIGLGAGVGGVGAGVQYTLGRRGERATQERIRQAKQAAARPNSALIERLDEAGFTMLGGRTEDVKKEDEEKLKKESSSPWGRLMSRLKPGAAAAATPGVAEAKIQIGETGLGAAHGTRDLLTHPVGVNNPNRQKVACELGVQTLVDELEKRAAKVGLPKPPKPKTPNMGIKSKGNKPPAMNLDRGSIKVPGMSGPAPAPPKPPKSSA